MKHRHRIPLRACILSAFALVSSSGMAGIIASYDFSTNGDTEDWSSLNITGLPTSGGFITGTASSSDPQLLQNTGSLTVGARQTWNTIVFRVRELHDVSGKYIGSEGAPAFNTVGLVVQANAMVIRSGLTAAASGGDFYTITANISTLGNAAITDLRADPIGGTTRRSR